MSLILFLALSVVLWFLLSLLFCCEVRGFNFLDIWCGFPMSCLFLWCLVCDFGLTLMMLDATCSSGILWGKLGGKGAAEFFFGTRVCTCGPSFPCDLVSFWVDSVDWGNRS